MRDDLGIKKSRDYLTNLFGRRSVIALCSGIFTLALAFYGIIAGALRRVEVSGVNGFSSFIYFTMIANTLAAFSVAFVIPFAVEGIKKRHFVLPKWVALMNYISATSIAIIMIFTVGFMSWASPADAFDGINLVMHVFSPILMLIAFFQIENGYIYSKKDCFIGCIPCFIYAIVYFVEVVVIGETNGGWPDLYRIQKYMPPAIGISFIMLFGLCVSWLVAAISNYLTKKREEKMFLHWEKDVDPIEAKIEAYGLGNMMSNVKDKNSITIPLNILKQKKKKSNLDIEKLIEPYIEGLMNSKKQ